MPVRPSARRKEFDITRASCYSRESVMFDLLTGFS